ncbi:plant UBX domain-containing protein 7-like [Humulus lupulus]|uniref:plant UBX domain-containing protein 7-like n=1 Tax=Humulus lupulus TaxID=3486 RepID=UPI002B40482F|nr:plant UBX domain-containing protein 7-like [Humulus lupulus]
MVLLLVFEDKNVKCLCYVSSRKTLFVLLRAKGTASSQDKWLLVNLQSTKEFSSHMLNRDTWANEAVSQTISTNFVFWQVYDDTTEGQKVYTYYKLDSIPVVLVIDPITGQKMRSWVGMVQPERLLEDLLTFMDSGPKDHHVTLSHKQPRESSIPVVLGIDRERVERMEARLKEDILREAERYGGAIMVIHETNDGQIFDQLPVFQCLCCCG